eukprot:CAMPEP_0175836106 /NCGR_PEP_ID=MMETSP0107_2-20121207/16962_1 /TAXON_ID=195067 ORGANISM="Goniomonas pacifica, Strain CCMP1869" /NCGR_SAMPLE_ID=MMETSP0107_2 /ASSEMBLY_ACC=CAM_ASM_000203 /LENGTH=170 /DNA_ID=CAMNT_0017149471 /DNA_START=1383 /DNA_END=1896 /DNA_ORIENTATION=-
MKITNTTTFLLHAMSPTLRCDEGFSTASDGYLELKQRKPIAITSDVLHWNDDPLIPQNRTLTLEDVSLPAIFRRYNDRNETAVYSADYQVWESTSLDYDSFKVFANVRIPKQRVVYEPAVMEVVKFSWVQFFSILLVLWWFSDRCLDVMFEQQVLSSRVVDPVFKKDHLM